MQWLVTNHSSVRDSAQSFQISRLLPQLLLPLPARILPFLCAPKQSVSSSHMLLHQLTGCVAQSWRSLRMVGRSVIVALSLQMGR